tara:strand:+ start:780 stop:1436 length:657 start_codon:yes stop_codon:yes gene_type:complete
MSNFLPNNVFFLHIPKTGGNWVRSIIRGSGVKEIKTNQISKHATYDLLAGVHNRTFFKSPISIKYFCVVRHPLLWYQSWFRYQQDKGWKNWGEKGNMLRWHCLTGINMKKQDDFNMFMTHVNNYSPGFLTSLYHSYVLNSGARYLKNENLKYELLSLNEDWCLGLNEKIIVDSEKINVSTKSEIIWDEKVLAETLENEIPLLKKYGYDSDASDLVKIK